MALNYTIQTLTTVLEEILGPEAAALIEKINQKPGSANSPFISLPTNISSIEETTRLIARTSNEYGQACRLAGLARAQFKIAEAAYKYKFRTSIGMGKNTAERESKAYAAASVEYEKMVVLEAIVQLCESIESATRIASESSRRMLLAADQSQKAEARYDFNAASLTEKDFSVI